MDLSQYVPTSSLLIIVIILAFILLIIFSVLFWKTDDDTKATENISFIFMISVMIILPLFLITEYFSTTPQKGARTKFAADIKTETGYTISENSASQILDQCYFSYHSDSIMATDKKGNKVALTYIIDDKTLNLFLASQSLLKDEGKIMNERT